MGHDLRVITPAYASVEQRNQASTVVDSLGVPLESGEILVPGVGIIPGNRARGKPSKGSGLPGRA